MELDWQRGVEVEASSLEPVGHRLMLLLQADDCRRQQSVDSRADEQVIRQLQAENQGQTGLSLGKRAKAIPDNLPTKCRGGG